MADGKVSEASTPECAKDMWMVNSKLTFTYFAIDVAFIAILCWLVPGATLWDVQRGIQRLQKWDQIASQDPPNFILETSLIHRRLSLSLQKSSWCTIFCVKSPDSICLNQNVGGAGIRGKTVCCIFRHSFTLPSAIYHRCWEGLLRMEGEFSGMFRVEE